MKSIKSDSAIVTHTPGAKRGRKPLGSKAMSAAERKRRSRELGRACGTKEFLLRVEGLHLEHVEALANSQQISTASALKLILDAALDRYVGVMRRAERMLNDGETENMVNRFLSDHLFPALPPMGASERVSNQT